MSNAQFERFYWPTLRRAMMGMIEEGLVPMPFAEGDYGARIEIIKDMPRTSVVWYFEAMDMVKAKSVLGNTSCIAGNLPVSVLCVGSAQQVREGCRRLIEGCGRGGATSSPQPRRSTRLLLRTSGP
jgi:uroporphyrinogen-III decarboxylase